jgi:hypothetical protein
MSESARIIWTEPVARLAATLRQEAEAAERAHDERGAVLLLETAERLESAIRDGSRAEYVDSTAAAEFRGTGEAAVRAWCRRSLKPKGLARKRGGRWEVHVEALQAA